MLEWSQDIQASIPIFVLNVDPVYKLVHIPTIEPIVYAAIDHTYEVAADLRALIFAIYFSALTSTLRGAADLKN